jgi:hypothetical protein
MPVGAIMPPEPRRRVTCPRCRQPHPGPRLKAGEWVDCSCGQRFLVPERVKRRDDSPTGWEARVAYALGGGLLLSIPFGLIAAVVGALFHVRTGWLLWGGAAVGFLVGTLLGERGINAIGRAIRGTLDRRI